MPATHYLLVALGGAIGAIMRGFLFSTLGPLIGKTFPFPTLLVNVVGSFLIGLLLAMTQQEIMSHAAWRPLLSVGLFGALTTFSTFSMETVLLLEQGAWFRALANVTANVVLCVLVCYLGYRMFRP